MAKNINIRSFTNRVTFGSMQVPYETKKNSVGLVLCCDLEKQLRTKTLHVDLGRRRRKGWEGSKRSSRSSTRSSMVPGTHM